jgi:hypothetical protein
MWIKFAWFSWAVTSGILFLYCLAGFIASHSPVAKLELTPGRVLDLDLLRLADDSFRFELWFKTREPGRLRPELGKWADADRRQAGFMKYAPASDVRIRVSTPNFPPIEYQAMPLGGANSDMILRHMTSNLSVEPGVWRDVPWYNLPSIRLHPGFNEIRLELTLVEPPLVGETVELMVLPTLGFKSASGLFFLWPVLLFWPLFALSQTVWLLCLAWYTYDRWRHTKGT